jgi:uncharacterized protein (DUF1697 family)
MKHVALLRGINVGGKNMLPMKALAEIFTGAGCRDVVTYIQSGNVVFRASATVLKKLPVVVSAKIADGFGHRVPVVIRSHNELAAVIRDNPFLQAGELEKTLFVAFLADLPGAEAVATLEPQRSPPDRFVVIGKDVHMHLLNHAAKTKLTNAWLDSKLSTISTARNWATVLKLHEMTKG